MARLRTLKDPLFVKFREADGMLRGGYSLTDPPQLSFFILEVQQNYMMNCSFTKQYYDVFFPFVKIRPFYVA